MIFTFLYHTRKHLLGFFIAAACAFLHCGVKVAGGTSTTDNPKVIGTIIGDDLHPATDTRVILLPESFDPVRDTADIIADTTDKFGRYELPVSQHGVYNIQAVSLVKKTRLLIQGIVVTTIDGSVRVSDDTLKHSGSIRVELPESIDRTNGYLCIPGTTIFKLIGDTGAQVTLDSVPAGTLPVVCYSTKNSTIPTVIRYNVRVFPDQITVIAKPGWKYSARLSLNTTSSGADIQSNVLNFPVLVRLSSSNFHFNEAKPHGEDIRFVNSRNMFVPYEIERWDATNNRAEIWVKIDTVYGNNSSQAITMYWGNADASDNSNSESVFDTSSGFAGVWHLSETSGSRAAEATNNGYSGFYKGLLPKTENSFLGICQKITRADSDYVDMGNVLNVGMRNISISIWIKRGSMTTPQGLISKTNGNLPSAGYGYLLAIDPGNFAHFNMAFGGKAWGTDSTFDIAGNLAISDTSTWHHIFVVIDRTDNSRCKMYVDGSDRTSSTKGNIASVGAVTNALHLRIGTENDNDYSFKGSVDEANIAFTVRSADWVKLSFMNQKENDALVKW